MLKSEWLRKFSGVFYALLIVTGVTILSFFEAFTLLDEWAYDVFERLTLNPQTRTSVLLVEAVPENQTQGDKTWLTLLKILKEKNAKQVIFTFMPKGVSNDFYCQAHKYGNVFFARSIQHNVQGEQRLEPLPDFPANCEIKFGVVDIPPHTHGIHRQQQAAFQIEGQSYPALEIVAAEHFFQKKTSFPKHSVSQFDAQYRVHFGKGLDEFPKLKLERIIAGGLISELVKERSVIIGMTRPSQVHGLHTPLAMTHDVMISMLEYHALALNTLLNMEERDHWLTYTFKNIGFGIPNERLQQYLFDSEVEISEPFANIRQALEFVKIWQSTLTAESQVGQGTSFELCLKSFI